MMQELTTLYKLIVLYMLDRVNFPLTTAQISDFILEKDYTNYFTLQTVLSELIDTGLVTSQAVGNRTQLNITEEGQTTLHYFEKRISGPIRDEITAYFTENKVALRQETAVQGIYYRLEGGDYEAQLCVKDRDTELVAIRLNVPTEELAREICSNWQKKNEEIYSYLAGQLF